MDGLLWGLNLMCACVCVYMCVCTCVYVCVWCKLYDHSKELLEHKHDDRSDCGSDGAITTILNKPDVLSASSIEWWSSQSDNSKMHQLGLIRTCYRDERLNQYLMLSGGIQQLGTYCRFLSQEHVNLLRKNTHKMLLAIYKNKDQRGIKELFKLLLVLHSD